MGNPDTAARPAIDKHRLAGLQDGVYSIAMTLLVLELKLPTLPHALTDAALWSALASVWPKALTWLLSFWVLALFWVGDARALSAHAAVDRWLLRVAMARLALVSLLPFSTAFMGEYGDRTPAAALYAGHLFLLAWVQTMRQLYLRRHVALAAWPDDAAARHAARNAFATLACAATACGLAFVAPGYNMLALLPLLFLGFRRDRHPSAA